MRLRPWTVGTALTLFFVAPALGEDEKSVADVLRELQPYVLLDGLDEDEARERRRELSRSLYEGAKELRREANEADVATWRNIDDREAWERLRDDRLAKLRAALGSFPEPPDDLHLRVPRTIPGDGFEIRSVLFESRPGLNVTANLYVPKPARDSMPGILICHSHHRPKTQGELQDMGMTWARAGCCVLVMDQLGHGERRAHPFASSSDFDGEFRVSRQDYHFRYTTGMQLHLLGDSLMGWMAWDLMRGVDLLCDMPGVDEDRLILLGAVAGGGDPAGVTAALDPRIDAVVPFNFGGPQPETVFPLPKDAEAAFNYFGGGSWESTRNLTASISDGFPHWLIVGSVAPRRMIHAHEFAWDRGHDPVWRRYQRIFGDFYDAPSHLSSAHGSGSVRGRPPEATHCTNIGPVHRSQIHPAFAKWFGIDADEYQSRLDESELHVLRGTDEQIAPPHATFVRVAKDRIAEVADSLPKDRTERRKRLREMWKLCLGNVDSTEALEDALDSKRVGPIAVTRQVIRQGDADLDRVPISMLSLAHARNIGRPTCAIVWLARASIPELLQKRADVIAAQLEAGYSVVLFEPRGTGLTEPGSDRGRRSNATGVSSTLLMLDRPILGLQLRDLQTVIRRHRKYSFRDVRIVLWADSLAEVNGNDDRVVVPLGSGHEPRIGEPMGHALALLGGLFDDYVEAVVSARGGLTTFRSTFDSEFVWLPHDVIVPAAIAAGDLDALAESYEPKPLKVSGRIDATNRRVEPEVPTEELVEWLSKHVKPAR